jgi:hypothetical protein
MALCPVDREAGWLLRRHPAPNPVRRPGVVEYQRSLGVRELVISTDRDGRDRATRWGSSELGPWRRADHRRRSWLPRGTQGLGGPTRPDAAPERVRRRRSAAVGRSSAIGEVLQRSESRVVAPHRAQIISLGSPEHRNHDDRHGDHCHGGQDDPHSDYSTRPSRRARSGTAAGVPTTPRTCSRSRHASRGVTRLPLSGTRWVRWR